MLLSRGIVRSKHSGVIATFGQDLVKSGEFRAADQRLLQAAFQDRNEGDYAGVFPSREKADQRIKDAEDFVARVANLLRGDRPEGGSTNPGGDAG